MSSNLPPNIAWPRHMDSELPGGVGEMMKIESNQPICRTVHGRLQDHLIGGVLQLRAPQEPERHRNGYFYQSIEYLVYLPRGQAAGVQMLLPCQDRLVFDDQRHRSKYFKRPIESTEQ